jgi:hypothetical protein
MPDEKYLAGIAAARAHAQARIPSSNIGTATQTRARKSNPLVGAAIEAALESDVDVEEELSPQAPLITPLQSAPPVAATTPEPPTAPLMSIDNHAALTETSPFLAPVPTSPEPPASAPTEPVIRQGVSFRQSEIERIGDLLEYLRKKRIRFGGKRGPTLIVRAGLEEIFRVFDEDPARFEEIMLRYQESRPSPSGSASS